jgi:hypothetical protein
MSVRFKDQYFTFNKMLEKHEDLNAPGKSYAKVSLSSSWKTNDGTRKYSDWICRFKGDSLNGSLDLKKGDFITCEGSFTREPYEKDGVRTWGDATMTIFSWKKWEDNRHYVPLGDSEDIPF